MEDDLGACEENGEMAVTYPRSQPRWGYRRGTEARMYRLDSERVQGPRDRDAIQPRARSWVDRPLGAQRLWPGTFRLRPKGSGDVIHSPQGEVVSREQSSPCPPAPDVQIAWT